MRPQPSSLHFDPGPLHISFCCDDRDFGDGKIPGLWLPVCYWPAIDTSTSRWWQTGSWLGVVLKAWPRVWFHHGGS